MHDRDHIGRRLDTLMLCALNRRTIRLACRKCSSVRLLDAVTLWWLFDRKGWSDRFPDVPRRFRCVSCWRDGRGLIRSPVIMVTEQPATGPQFPYPSEQVWKRLVSRYRS
jgi:hypothetical protein